MKTLIFSFMFSLGSTAMALNDAVVIPIPVIPQSIDVINIPTTYAGQIASLVTEGLFGAGQGFQIVPLVAESSKWSKDRLTLEIDLRKREFSDGSNLTASDVVRSLSQCIFTHRKSVSVAFKHIHGYSSFAEEKTSNLAGVQADGNMRVKITLSNPAPLLLDELTQRNCNVVKADRKGGTDILNGALGTGPYRIVERRDDQLELKRNATAPTTIPERVTFRQQTDMTSFDAMKEWADVMILENAPPNADSFSQFEYYERNSQHLVFNNSSAPFSDARIRRAVSDALDFGVWSREMNIPETRLQKGLVPFGMRGFQKRISMRDVGRANEKLASLGYSQKKPLLFEIMIRDTPEGRAEGPIWGQVFAGSFAKPAVKFVPLDQLFKKTADGEFQAARVGKDPASIDPHRLLSSYLTASKWNNTLSKEPECDRLIEVSFEQLNLDARYEAYGKADRCLIDDKAILVPLHSSKPKTVLIRKPWTLNRENRYLIYPHRVYEWRRDQK